MKNIVKTVCTIGPSSEKPEVLEQLVLAGMDIARLNFSHATYDQYLRIKKSLDKFNNKYKKDVKMMMDLQGPRMRVGVMPVDGLMLKEGTDVTFSTDPHNKTAIHINDPYLHEDIQTNHPIFLSNGELELMVTQTMGTEFRARVIRGGLLFSRKGVNVPDTNLTTRGVTPKDIKDIEFGVKNNVDYIAMSFVKDGLDLRHVREYIGKSRIKIISKVERKQAIAHLDEIIEESDIIMVARGDLGVELPVEEIPLLQKEMIQRAKRLGKPSIVATQMLMSMVNHPHPTRAEVSDVANAVLDGAWGVMLSDESAFGQYPLKSLEYLLRIARRVEEYLAS